MTSASSAACISSCASQATSSRISGSGRPSENSSLDVAADTAGRRYPTRHGRRRVLRDLAVSKENLRSSSDLHPSWAPPQSPPAASPVLASAPLRPLGPALPRRLLVLRDPDGDDVSHLEPGAWWESGSRAVSVTCCLIRSVVEPPTGALIVVGFAVVLRGRGGNAIPRAAGHDRRRAHKPER